MSKGTAGNRATADGEAERALVRYADILDGRKRLATFGIKGAFHDGDDNPEDFLFYKNENGHLPPEIESAFACVCDELRKAGHSPAAAAIVNLHGQLTEKFAKAAGYFRDAVFVYGNCRAFIIRASRDMDALREGPDPEEPPTSDKAAHALWEQTMDRRTDEAFIKLYDIYGHRLFTRYAPFCHAEKDFETLRKSLEECFEQNAAVVRGIIKAGVRDIHGEKLEQIIEAIRLGNRAQAETKQAVVEMREDVREVKTAAEGAEKIGAKTHGLLAAIFAKLPERLKRSIKSVGEVFDPARKEKRSAVYDLWKQYSNPDEAADPEMPDGSFRGRGERRSYKDFFKRYEDVVVWGHLTLGIIYKSVEELETAINSEDHFRHPEKRLKKQTKGKSKKK